MATPGLTVPNLAVAQSWIKASPPESKLLLPVDQVRALPPAWRLRIKRAVVFPLQMFWTTWPSPLSTRRCPGNLRWMPAATSPAAHSGS